jgi:hypothetical protein
VDDPHTLACPAAEPAWVRDNRVPVLDVGDRLETPHGRLDLAREVIAVMFHPQSRDARRQRQVAFAVTLLALSDEHDEPETREQAKTWFKKGGGIKTDDKADRYQTQQQAVQVPWIVTVGALLQEVWAMAAHHEDQLTGGASLNKAIALSAKFPYFAPMAPRTLRSAWSRYGDVAHLCAAFTSVFDEARREPPERLDERMKRGFHEDLHETLGVAAAYQHFGTTFSPRGTASPLINPETAWLLRGIEPDLHFLPPPLPTDLLAEVQRYKALRNVAYR